MLETAQFIPIDQLGTSSNHGFDLYANDTLTPREVCYQKIKGTKLAEQILNKE